jgi:hypothetical protein
MCCCGKPTINGELGFRWNRPNAEPGIYPVNPPAVGEGETILYDEPGRCGGIDSHSHHYRVVRSRGTAMLFVRHGGGDERIRLSNATAVVNALAALDSNGRYWLLNAIYHAQNDAARDARVKERARWYSAAQDKRIRTRKERGGSYVKVWIENAA